MHWGRKTAEEIGKSNFRESGGERRFECGFPTWRKVTRETERERERRSIDRSITPRPKVYEEIWSTARQIKVSPAFLDP